MSKDFVKESKSSISISGMKKTMGLVILTILSILLLVGCNKKSDDLDTENPNEQTDIQPNEETEEQPIEETEELAVGETDNQTMVEDVVNNGGMYVSYNGKVYYRQYTAESFSETGIFGSYDPVPEAPKNMMYIKEDGTTEIAFADTGVGKIYIYNNRMYLGKQGEDLLPKVYSVDLDGSNETEIGSGWIKGIDEATGTLICVLANRDNYYQLFRIDGTTGETKEYDLEVLCSEFLAIKDGVIYYTGEVAFESAILGEMILCSVNIDGSNEKVLAHSNPDIYEFGDRGTTVPCIQFVGNTIYFSFGAYGGTGNFYQGGKIAKVQKDGSEFTVLLGDINAGEDQNFNLVYDIFYVTSVNDEEILYYSQISENQELENFGYNLTNGEIEATSFEIYSEGVPFEYQGGVSIYMDASSEMTTWIPEVTYQTIELEEDADYYTINDIEVCDNWVYYRLEANQEDSEASIGWREGYRRVKTMVIREQLVGDTIEILFQY